jgi:hypothetical protein
MKLSDFRNADFGEFEEFEIEDVSLVRTMVWRMVEDMDIGAYILAKARGKKIEEDLMRELFRLIDPETEVSDQTPEAAITSPAMVRDLSRAPVQHSEKAISLLSRFINQHLIDMFRAAAKQAVKEGLKTIKLRHILPGCERWPWPLNRYC